MRAIKVPWTGAAVRAVGDAAAASVTAASVTAASVTAASVTEDSVTEDSVTEDSVTEDSVTEASVTEASVTEDSVTKDSVTEDSVTKDSVTKDSVIEDPGRPPGVRLLISRVFAERWILLWVWLLLIVIFTALSPAAFFTFGNVQTILGSQSTLVFVSLAVLFPLLVGEFDLSVGANLGLVTSVVAILNVSLHLPIAVSVVLALAVGGLIGAINGFFVVTMGVDGIITTLAVGTLATGVTYAITNYVTISGISTGLVSVTTNQLLGVPYSFYFGVFAAVVIWYVLRYMPLGQYLLFVGRSRDVARLSGLNVQGIRFASFVVAGLFAALAGVILAGTVGSADPTVGTTFLLPAYSAAFLGATTITPGRFNPLGTLVAVYFLVTGITGLQIMGLSDWVQQVFYGISLLFAVTVSVLARRRPTRARGGAQ